MRARRAAAGDRVANVEGCAVVLRRSHVAPTLASAPSIVAAMIAVVLVRAAGSILARDPFRVNVALNG